MPKVFFQLWNPTGMINQVMSLELAVGIANQTKNEVIVHYVSNSGDESFNFRKVPIYTPSRWYNNQRAGFTNPDQFPHLLDLVEFEENLTFIDEKIEKFPQETTLIPDLMNDYYFTHGTGETEEEIRFAEGRKKLYFSSATHLKGTLGWYSRFFFTRSSELDLALSKVKFKAEYTEFAKDIAKSIGEFQGAHLRLSDHIHMFETTQDMFEDGLRHLEKNNLPIVICTDQPTHKMVTDNKDKFLLLDEYIVNNYEKEFKSLKYQDEVTFGLLCNLVMHYSKYFIGTPGSTYSAYIQRIRNQAGLIETWDLFGGLKQTHGTPYSWNDYNLENGRKMWWREWPESKLNF